MKKFILEFTSKDYEITFRKGRGLGCTIILIEKGNNVAVMMVTKEFMDCVEDDVMYLAMKDHFEKALKC